MIVDLTPDEAKLLHRVLAAQLDKVEAELVHTDKRQMQRDIANDAAQLRALIGRLAVT
jgi:hypothetical protein